MNLLSMVFSNIKINSASMAQSTAVVESVDNHHHNKKPLPTYMIDLKLFVPPLKTSS